ncbi:hypothetical protein NDU88_002079 [Pleurodeles waltl]|uniref:Uncharacterized protein n=1 Tax=Pleurodeles waltl TaxID=8319 RepID=A0AAV7UXP6_PLEWA|nr:hypothetical protein NDU88_002079 [Pleurodeles waltl]
MQFINELNIPGGAVLEWTVTLAIGSVSHRAYIFVKNKSEMKNTKKVWADAPLPVTGLPSLLLMDRVASEANADPLLGF